jgi:hypothetical protein
MNRLALMLVLVGCSYRERSRTIHPTELGSPAAVITNYLSAPVRAGQPTEDTPGGVSRAAIVDEARLDLVSPGQACVSFVERTHVDLDMPLSDWNFKLGGAEIHPADERVTVRDHSYRGERDVVVADAVTPTALASLRVTEPTDEVYRVFERTGHACGPVTGNQIVLEVERPMDDHRGSWGEKFVWNLN